MNKLRVLFFILVIIVLDYNNFSNKLNLINSSNANTQESIDEKADKARRKLEAYSDKASNPECGVSTIAAATAATALTASIGLMIIGIALSSNPISIKAGLVMTTIATVEIVATIVANTMLFACKYAFVRHPVLRNDKGDYQTCVKPKLMYMDKNKDKPIEVCPEHKYKSVSKYGWPKNRIPYSDYIEFCHREALGGVGTTLDPRELEFASEFIKNKKNVGGSLECKKLKAGEDTIVHSIKYAASNRGDKLCVTALGIGQMTWWPQPIIGCHLKRPGIQAPLCKKSIPVKDSSGMITDYDNSLCASCYISSACSGKYGIFAHAPLVMTSMVVQCLKESLSNVLLGCDTNNTKQGFLDTAKKYLKNTVKAVLVLAIMLFGIKVLLGTINSHTEVMLLLIKISLVYYFTIGDGMNFYYKELGNFSLALADKVFAVDDGNATVCNYKSSDYIYPVPDIKNPLNDNENALYKKMILNNKAYSDKAGISGAKNVLDEKNLFSNADFNSFANKLKFENYSYLAIWDRLDCRIMFYLGQSVSQGVGYSLLSLLLIIPGFLFAGQIIITICVLVFVAMLLFLVVWVVHVFIISFIALTIITLFAPLFIPMCLFQYTKGFFDGWLKELITYAIYPVILFAFLGIMFSVFDHLYFGDLKFEMVKDENVNATRAIYNFKLSPIDQCDSRTSNLACVVTSTNFITKPLIFGINVTAADTLGDTGVLWKKCAMLAIMGFFFFHFLQVIGSFIGELSGNFRANLGAMVTSPVDMAKNTLATAVQGGKAVANKISSGGKKRDEGKKEAVSGGSPSDGKKNEGGTSEGKGRATATEGSSSKDESEGGEASTNNATQDDAGGQDVREARGDDEGTRGRASSIGSDPGEEN